MLKGEGAEDLLASVAVVVLLAVFALSIISSYSGFLARAGHTESGRSALALSERIFHDSGGTVLPDEIKAYGKNGTAVLLMDLETGENFTTGTAGGTDIAISSLPVLVFYENGAFHPGRIEVHVSK
jgi:hypothetical protein